MIRLIGLAVVAAAALYGWSIAHTMWPKLVTSGPPAVWDQVAAWFGSIRITRTGTASATTDTAWTLPDVPWMLLAIAVLAVLAVIGTIRGRRQARPQWSTARMTAGFTRAGITGKDAPDVYVTRVHHADDSTIINVTLPAGIVASQVVAKREALAAALTIPLDRLAVTMAAGRADRIHLTITDPEPTLETREATLPDPCWWRDPVLLGRDTRGRDVTAPVYDIGQWLVGGLTGSGKTTLLRLLAAHYALDPDATIWGADGKGSRDDWAPLRPRVDRWVDVTDDDAAGMYLSLIRDAVKVVTARNSAGGRHHPGMLIILEEATAFRASLTPYEQAEVDKLLTRLVQTCRSANVLVVTAAQRPSATLMSADVRAQSGVGILMRVRTGTDAEMVLGYRPTLPLPDAPGRALIDVGDGQTRRILVDWLTDDAWRDLCRQVTPTPQDAPSIEGPKQDTTLLTAAYAAVTAAGGWMTTAELLAALPEGLTTTTEPRKLGRELTALGWPARSERVDGVTVRVRYSDDAPAHVIGHVIAT